MSCSAYRANVESTDELYHVDLGVPLGPDARTQDENLPLVFAYRAHYSDSLDTTTIRYYQQGDCQARKQLSKYSQTYNGDNIGTCRI
jgi:hypothetical protein